MFIHYLKFRMPIEFVELIKTFQNKIDVMDVTVNSSWTENYTKSIILFEGQSKGHPDKIQNNIDINNLLNGFISRYFNILPEIYINDLIITTSKKGRRNICLVISSSFINQMRMYLFDNFGYNFYSADDIVIKKFKNSDGTDNIIKESINIELPIIGEAYIKKNINIYDLYITLSNILVSSKLYNSSIKPESIIFETENKRGKKFHLW